jgi:hypothetical protein
MICIIQNYYYLNTYDFHKKKEKFPQSAVPPAPEDGEILKLLTAIQQLDKYIKELQDMQLKVLKQDE